VSIPVGLPEGKILVTGGNGFIGGHVVDNLKARGYGVTVLDRFGEPHRKDVEFILGDVRDKECVRLVTSQHQGIINLAGILGTSETIEHPQRAVSSNMLGAINIFNAARDFGCRVTHITVGNHWMNNPYAITKSAGERLALLYNSRFGTKISVVRGLNAYGERQKAWPVRKIIPNFVLPAIRNDKILVYGDGDQQMDMIYVGDLAEILVRALILDHGAWHTIFEAGTGDAPTVNEIADRVLANVDGSTAEVTRLPMRQGEPEHSLVVGNPDTLRPLGIEKNQMLGLDGGLRKTVAYYRTIA
jgi:UDP-glucose 4-epimerase